MLTSLIALFFGLILWFVVVHDLFLDLIDWLSGFCPVHFAQLVAVLPLNARAIRQNYEIYSK